MDPRVEQLMALGMTEAEARAFLGLPPVEAEPEPLDPVRAVRLIIESLDGGINGDVPDHQIEQVWTSDREAVYGLRVLDNDAPTKVLRRVRLTLEPMEDHIDEPIADSTAVSQESAPESASDRGIVEGDTEEVA